MGGFLATPPGAPKEASRMTRAQQVARERDPVKKAALLLGPGFITGAADDDPSGIGTYSVAGASLGLATLWTALLTFPFMAAVQNICARLGQVAGCGLAGILKEHYPRWVLYPAVALVVVANIVNVGADLGAIADAAGIIVGAPIPWLVVPIALALLAMQVFARYRLIERVFKYLTIALLAYVIDAVLINPPVGETIRATIVPTISTDHGYLATLVAILGTTISPYLFFWQSSQEVEEERAAGRKTRRQRRGASRFELRIATIDVTVGMWVSNLVMYFIILTTALTLHVSGKTDISTGADAAQALRPLAGDLAGIIFAIGMIGTGLLAVPVLAGASAYAVLRHRRARDPRRPLHPLHRRETDRRPLLYVCPERRRSAIPPRRHHAGRRQQEGDGPPNDRAGAQGARVDRDDRDVRSTSRPRAHVVRLVGAGRHARGVAAPTHTSCPDGSGLSRALPGRSSHRARTLRGDLPCFARERRRELRQRVHDLRLASRGCDLGILRRGNQRRRDGSSYASGSDRRDHAQFPHAHHPHLGSTMKADGKP